MTSRTLELPRTLSARAPAAASAGLAVRLAATAIDLVVVGTVVVIGALAAHMVIAVLPAQVAEVESWGLLALGAIVLTGYFVYFWGVEGATPGKKLMGLRVTRPGTGQPIGPGRALLRLVGITAGQHPLRGPDRRVPAPGPPGAPRYHRGLDRSGGSADAPFLLRSTSLGLGLALCRSASRRGATFTVTNTNDSGGGSLRQAILDANTAAGADTIDFNIPGTGPFQILPVSILPPLAGGDDPRRHDPARLRGHASDRDLHLQRRGAPHDGNGREHDPRRLRQRLLRRHPDRVERQPRRGLLHRHGSDRDDRGAERGGRRSHVRRERERDRRLRRGSPEPHQRKHRRHPVHGRRRERHPGQPHRNVDHRQLADFQRPRHRPDGNHGLSDRGTESRRGQRHLRKHRRRHLRHQRKRLHDPGKPHRHERGRDGGAPQPVRDLRHRSSGPGHRRRLQRRRGKPDLRKY